MKAVDLIIQASEIGSKSRHEEALKLLAEAEPLVENEIELQSLQYERAFQTLMLKNFKDGFELWKARESYQNIKSQFQKLLPKMSEWSGEEGVDVLVVAEKGLGDTILFSRYLNILFNKKCNVWFLCSHNSRPIRTVLEQHPQIVHVLNSTDYIPEVPYWIALECLPLFTDELPPLIKFPKMEFEKSKFRVGICWNGSPMNAARDRQPYNLDLWMSLFGIPGVEYQSLRLGEKWMCDLSLPETATLSKTVQVIESCDVVVSIDTSIAHLASSINKITVMPLSNRIYWPWVMISEDQCIWYPSLKIFREGKGYTHTFKEIREYIQSLI